MDNEIPNQASDNFTHSGCPHLGIVDDASTVISFPSSQNRCYRCKPTLCPSYAHQKNVCLQSTFKECPLLINQKLHRLEKDLVWKSTSDQKLKNIIGIVLQVLFVFLAVAASYMEREMGGPLRMFFLQKRQS